MRSSLFAGAISLAAALALTCGFGDIARANAQRALTADQVVGKVQSFYKETDRLSAKFRQKVFDPVFGREDSSVGRVYIKKPGKMRWDYYGKKTRSKPARKTKSFISDGKTVWAVHYDDKTAMRQSLENYVLPVAVTFLSGTGDLRRDFTAELDTSSTYGKKGDYVLRLTPKQPSAQYQHLWLVVDPSNFRVKQSIVVDAKGERNSFEFYEPNTQKAVKDTWFAVSERTLKQKKYRLITPDSDK